MFHGGAGGRVEFKVNGQIVGRGTGDAEGTADLVTNLQLQRGDRICIYLNGVQLECWSFC